MSDRHRIIDKCTSRWLAACLCVCAAIGCGRNPYAPGAYYGAPYGTQYPMGLGGAPGVAAGNPAQLAELERRIQQLDMDNRQLTTQLAQSQQRMQVADQRANLFQQQLADASNQLQQARLAQQDLQSQTRGLQASMNSRGGATLRPNVSGQSGVPGLMGNPAMPPSSNGYAMQPNPSAPVPMGSQLGSQLGSLASIGSLPPISNIQIPGASVQMEGQSVRIRVPADQLFSPGSAQLNSTAYQVLDRVADSVHKYFPRNRISIEAHTDAGSTTLGQQTNQYQLAAAQAQAVLDQLARRNQLDARQLTTVASGPNLPRADNQSAAGRAENRRIEFVVGL